MKTTVHKGTKLFRCDVIDPPDNWSTNFKSPFYVFSDIGQKNVISAFFFFDNQEVAKKYIQLKIEESTNKKIDTVWITETTVKNDIQLLDLSTIKNVIDLYVFLWEHGYNEYFDKAYCIRPHLPSIPLKTIKDEVRIISEKKCNQEALDEAVYAIRKLSYGEDEESQLRYACQQLTDFVNGSVFKEILEKRGIQGYTFKELEANTVCIFDSVYLNAPQKAQIKLA